jgi:hypothetical protein
MPIYPTSIIPDCTLTTACFCVHDKNNNAFSIEQIIENIGELMKLPVYLVINCDSIMYPIIQEQRKQFEHITKYNLVEYKDIWTYKYEDKVNKNREIFWGSRDPRAGTDSHLITCNKFDFVLQTIEENPFQTSKFGWIDCFVRKNMTKIAENYSPNLIPHILSNISDKFHIQILNVNDKKYKLPENKREYYNEYRYVICGCFFTCSKDIGVKILKRAKEIFIQTTEAGFGHSEEMLYLEILDEFYDDIHRSYGDYGQILNNFLKPSNNFHYIYYLIFNRYFDFEYRKECFDCGKILLNEIKSHNVFSGSMIHFQIAFKLYIVAFYYKHEEAKEIAQYIIDVCKANSNLKSEWNKNPGYHREQLKHIVDVPDDF